MPEPIQYDLEMTYIITTTSISTSTKVSTVKVNITRNETCAITLPLYIYSFWGGMDAPQKARRSMVNGKSALKLGGTLSGSADNICKTQRNMRPAPMTDPEIVRKH